MKTTKKKRGFPRFKFTWNSTKKEKSFERPTIDSTEVLINGKLFTCIVLSIVSAFIDIVFFSGLSKSGYPFFAITIPASIILSIMSIGFSAGKFFVAMQLAAIKEIESRLRELKYEVKNRFRWLKLKWNAVHKFIIGISIITSMSLSVITIGNGVRAMEQNIKSMTSDANELIELNNSVNSGVKEKRAAAKSNITGSITAKDDAKQEVSRYYDRLVSYQEEYFALSDEDKASEKGEAIITKIVKEIPGASRRNALYFTKADLQKSVQSTALKNESIDDSEIYEEAVAYDKSQIDDKIKALADRDYKTPDGTSLVFLNEDGTAVNVQLAISRLQNAISLWQSDTGDAGASSKIFTLIATYLHADETAGGLGVSEIIMMVLIMIFGIVQEFLIAIFTPRATINRKMLSQFSEYLDGVDLNMFMLYTYKSYLDRGILTTEAFEAKSKKAVYLMENGVDEIIKKYSIHNTERIELEEKDSKIAELIAEKNSTDNKIDNLTKRAVAAEEQINSLLGENLELQNRVKELETKKPAETATRKIVEKEFSPQVDNAVKEIEDLLK